MLADLDLQGRYSALRRVPGCAPDGSLTLLWPTRTLGGIFRSAFNPSLSHTASVRHCTETDENRRSHLSIRWAGRCAPPRPADAYSAQLRLNEGNRAFAALLEGPAGRGRRQRPPHRRGRSAGSRPDIRRRCAETAPVCGRAGLLRRAGAGRTVSMKAERPLCGPCSRQWPGDLRIGEPALRSRASGRQPPIGRRPRPVAAAPSPQRSMPFSTRRDICLDHQPFAPRHSIGNSLSCRRLRGALSMYWQTSGQAQAIP